MKSRKRTAWKNGGKKLKKQTMFTTLLFSSLLISCFYTSVARPVYAEGFDIQNETIEISMSFEGTLTQEEHDWLEAVYECLIEGTGCAS